MKTNPKCKTCIYYGSKQEFCNEMEICSHFTLQSHLIQYQSSELINESRKDDLYKHFFYSIRFWIDGYSKYNVDNNTNWYYSLDQDKFVKRSTRNKAGIGNWIKIEYNIYHFLWLRSKLGYDDPHLNISLKGRMINGTFVKDDLFLNYESFIKNTFNKFFNENKKPIKNNSNNTKNYETTKLF
jgi:hypothetical protein